MKKSGIEVIVDTIVENVPTHKLLSLSNIFEDGSWKQQNIEHFIGNNVIETALSAKERNALIGSPFSLLEEAKTKLRQSTSPSKAEGSELAEIILYGIMKRHYSALPIVPKIFYKQNSMDYAKGADSIHLIIENDDFSIWMGECKFYSDLNSAFNEALSSVNSLLATDKLRKENSIITNLNELNELQKNNEKLTKEMTHQVLQFMERSNSIDNFKPKLHVPIFILHECDLVKNASEFSNKYKIGLQNKHNRVAGEFFRNKTKQLESIPKIGTIHFHLILLPIPDKSKLIFWYQNSFLGGLNA